MPKPASDAEKSNDRKVRHPGYAFTAGQGVFLLLSLFIVVVTLSVYAQTRDFAFLNYDDPIYTTDNDVVQKGLTLSGVIWAFTEGTSHTNYWAPLTRITFLIDHELYGLDPGGYHITN